MSSGATPLGDSFADAFLTGFVDRHVARLMRIEQMYRFPWTNRVAWRLGWEVANLMTRKPLRTEARHGE